MSLEVRGLHHYTAICGDPTENAKFYVNVLGLRMIKKSVNHDAPHIYHLYYGDYTGTPGSSITFFPNMAGSEAEFGAGMITELGLRIPEDSLNYWENRLEKEEVDFESETWHGCGSLSFEDWHGMPLRLVPGKSKDYKPWNESTVPEEYQIRGMNHVTLTVGNPNNTVQLIEKMGLEKQERESESKLFRAEDNSFVEVKQSSKQGSIGTGSAHHIAYKVVDSLEDWRDKIKNLGLYPTDLVDRKYFTSFYFREPGGILFEFSSMDPGFTVDETVENLGSSLVLPENLEGRRKEIENRLPEFREEEIQR